LQLHLAQPAHVQHLWQRLASWCQPQLQAWLLCCQGLLSLGMLPLHLHSALLHGLLHLLHPAHHQACRLLWCAAQAALQVQTCAAAASQG
jgi:hypothetical protein